MLDPIHIAIGLGVTFTISTAIGVAMKFERDRLRDVSAAAYQLAAAILLNDEKEERELDTEETLLLNVLADSNGAEAAALINAPAGTSYAEIAMEAKNVIAIEAAELTAEKKCSCSSVAERSPVQG